MIGVKENTRRKFSDTPQNMLNVECVHRSLTIWCTCKSTDGVINFKKKLTETLLNETRKKNQ